LTAGAISTLATVAFAGPAIACGGLVGENGTIQLVRTTTLAAYHDGVERYVTSFEFTGEGERSADRPRPTSPPRSSGGDRRCSSLRGSAATGKRLALQKMPAKPVPR
jgi:hypothetical protein